MDLVWMHNIRAMIETSPMFSEEMRKRCLKRFNELLEAENAHQAFRLQNDREWKAKVDHQKVRAEAYRVKLGSVAAKAREYAAHYPQASDGRNTFTIFAEWIEALVSEECTQTLDSESDNQILREALEAVTAATGAYLPPDGISQRGCLSRILAATDNPKINAVLMGDTAARKAKSTGGDDE